MNFITKFIRKLKRQKNVDTFYPEGKKTKGRALVSYLPIPEPYKKDYVDSHVIVKESMMLCKVLNDNGYIVDVIRFSNNEFGPKYQYDIVIDHYSNLARLNDRWKNEPLKFFFWNGSYINFHNNAELSRIADIEQRKGVKLEPRRQLENPEFWEESIEISDNIILVGSEQTKSTFPEKYHEKIITLPVMPSTLNYIKQEEDFIPEKSEFLYHFGGGAVHKGLYLALEAFAKNPHLTLNITANVDAEADFKEAYRHELFELPNIKYLGYIPTHSGLYKEICSRCFAFVAPSCSEGTSVSVVNCTQIGMYPIVSTNTGIIYPDDAGIYLRTSTVEELEEAVNKAYNLSDEELKNQIKICQEYAFERYKDENFYNELNEFLQKKLEEHRG